MTVKPIHFIPSNSADLTPLGRRLHKEIRGDVFFSKADRGRYATDASIYQIMPIGIVVPRDQDDLIRCLDIARAENVPVLARGGGTSQCGQTVGEALVIDNSKWLNNIVSFSPEDFTITVEPGLVLDHLNSWLKPHGLWFPVDVSTAAQCTIGGMAGNNSCGSRSIEYGNMVHNVVSIDTILADGTQGRFESMHRMAGGSRIQEIIRGLKHIATEEQREIVERIPKVLRRVGGYNIDLFDCQNPRAYTDDGSANLAHILVGSEGTLGYSRQLTLKLVPLPKHKVLGVINFPTFYKAMDSAQHIVKLLPTAVELVDSTMIALSLHNPSFKPVIEKALVGNPQAILLVEFAGDDKELLMTRLAALSDLMSDHGLPGSVVDMIDAAAQKALWDVRKAGLNIMMSMKGDGKPVSFIEDCAVPLVHLAEYTSRLTEVFHKYQTEGTWYAHASVGTLHVRPILDMRRDGASDMRKIAEEASALVQEYKGAYSGEHGDGLCRGEWVAWQYGPKINRAFTQIKHLFDPDNRLSPDRIVAPPKMDDKSNFRFAPGYQERPLQTQLDWSAWDVRRDPATGVETAPGTGNDKTGGLAKAIEMCNNNGHCRKFDADTMCPSYRITKDEKHLTRGRANTLRLALSGQLGDEGLSSSDVQDALDLCVSCKGCKRDCPTGIDMAKYKIEARAAWAKQHGHSLRDKAVAYLPQYAPYAVRLRGLLAVADGLPWISGWLKKSMGLTPQRRFPRFKSSFLSTLRASSPSKNTGNKEVLLFVDTFNNYMEPENAKAAQTVLEAAGYTVHFNVQADSRPLCCGRTYLSAGMVDQAKKEARRTLDALKPFVDKGIAIVGLEPSCLLSLRDEFLAYGYGDEAKKLAALSFLFEEFLLREHTAGRMQLALKPLDAPKVMLHGHCHQKAFDAFRPVQTVLNWIPHIEMTVIESSCCGMAGSFGYEDEHYAASQAMAELALFPALRKAEDNALVVADGTSCRHQIKDGLEKDAIHVARVIAMAL